MKYVFIINRASGKTNYDTLIQKIERYMEGKEYKIVETKCPLDATKIASKYKNDRDTIIYACGGDGTLNEVASGVAGGKCKLALIPTGSGNDFYKSLKAYNKKESTIDLGKINDKYFINIASVGFDANVCKYANDIKLSGKHKKSSYIRGVLKALFNYHNRDYEIEIDNKKYNGKKTLIAICNGRYYGGGFKIAPLASFDDDHFDVYLAKDMNPFKLIFMLTKLLRGKHEQSSLVKKIKATKVYIKCKEKMIVNIDGEIVEACKLKIELLKDAIHLYNDKEIINNVLE